MAREQFQQTLSILQRNNNFLETNEHRLSFQKKKRFNRHEDRTVMLPFPRRDEMRFRFGSRQKYFYSHNTSYSH